MRKALRDIGLRGYRIHYNIVGKPDIVFTSVKLAIFIDGDFWHGYLWKKCGNVPEKPYWKEKIAGNMDRDKQVNRELKKIGWKVIRIWEHDAMKKSQVAAFKIQKAYMCLVQQKT